MTETPLDRDPLDRDPLDRDTETKTETTLPTPHCGQKDTCENITFANFVCGW